MANESIRISAQAGFKSLYHYQNFHPAVHADRLIDILRNHRIYCSNPMDFNDPWDCKPYFDPDLLDDPAHRAATAEAFIANQRGGPQGDRVDQLLRTNPVLLKKLLQQFSEEQLHFITTRWGVYCLSPDPCSTLMWSHYSHHHKGICLEFGTEHSKFSYAWKMQYQKEYPAILLHNPASYMQMLLTKSDVWAYEDEFRMICPRFTDIKEHPLIMDGQYLSIGATDLKSIIVGCQADNDAIAALKTLVGEHAPAVQVRRAIRASNKYRAVMDG